MTARLVWSCACASVGFRREMRLCVCKRVCVRVCGRVRVHVRVGGIALACVCLAIGGECVC